MNLRDIRTILLTQAIEETDREGKVAPFAEREAATAEARPRIKESENRFLTTRAAILADWLAARHAGIQSAASTLAGPAVIGIAVVILAAVSGFLSNELGPDQRINILAFPLLGMLAWNFGVYLLEIVRNFVKAPSIGLMSWLSQLLGRRTHPAAGPLSMGLTMFATNWTKAAAPATIARLRTVFHLGAAVFAASAIGGMYVQGLANEYRAIWESTFLDADAVQRLVNAILGSAAAVIGEPVPAVENMRWTAGDPGAGQNAAPWIHLYAVTITMFIVVPRLALALIWTLRGAARIRAISVRDFAPAYFDRLLAEGRGESISTKVIPYCHKVSEALQKRVAGELANLLGGPVKVDWGEAILFGEEAEASGKLGRLPSHLALLFNFSATPETETHGELVRGIQAKLAGSETGFRILLDASAYDEKRRALPDFADRRKAREQAWLRLFEENAKRVSVLGP